MLLTTSQLILFSRSRATYPEGLTIGQVPVGNLSREQAAERLLEAYSLPVQLEYNDQLIQLDPAVVSFELNMESMLAAADLTRTGGPFWAEFWEYLMGNQRRPAPIPLDSSYSETQLRTYLQTEVAPRYDQPPTPAQPIPGTVNFSEGSPGSTVNVDDAVNAVEQALTSPSDRFVSVPAERTTSARPSLANLEILLKQTIDIVGFDGIAGIYLLDLQSADEIHFVYQNGEDLSTEPDMSFTASSIIKIPILVSAYRRLPEPTPADAELYISGMIEESGNDPADWLMEGYISSARGPIEVTNDMQALGLDNTFLAGFFRFGSPLLAFYDTPANSRPDSIPNNDPYNQTTTSDIGMLLADLYQCAESGGGSLVAVFPGEISQTECRAMISFLSRNYTPFLIEAGVPEGTQIAHKHGWVSDETGAITTIGDAGLVFTPSGDYVLVIYFYHPVQLVWDPISTLIADLSRAIYNYYNLSG